LNTFPARASGSRTIWRIRQNSTSKNSIRCNDAIRSWDERSGDRSAKYDNREDQSATVFARLRQFLLVCYCPNSSAAQRFEMRKYK